MVCKLTEQLYSNGFFETNLEISFIFILFKNLDGNLFVFEKAE